MKMLFRSIFTLTKCHEEFSMIYQGVAVSRCKWYECTKLGVSILLITTLVPIPRAVRAVTLKALYITLVSYSRYGQHSEIRWCLRECLSY